MSNQKKKKFFNFRPFVLLLVVGLLSAYASFYLVKSWAYALIFILPVALILYIIYKKKYILLAVSCVFLVMCMAMPFVYAKNFERSNAELNGKEVVLVGKIDDVNDCGSGFYNVYLGDVRAVVGGKEHKIDGKVSATIVDFTNSVYAPERYHTVSFTAVLKSTPLLVDGLANSFVVKSNVKYEVEDLVNIFDVVTLKDSATLFENFREYNRSLLVEVMGEDNGNLAYAVLYGDRSYANDDDVDLFRETGTVHMLVVSGLHVSLMALILNFLLAKMRVFGVPRFIILFMLLGCFCALCDFSPSVVRASVMALVVSSAYIFWKKYDVLNSLCFAGMLLLFINPLCVFDCGYLMSFASVFGIVTFMSVFRKWWLRNKLLEAVILSLATSFAVETALLPIISFLYGSAPILSVLANLITIPLFSIFYVLLFVINILVLIIPSIRVIYIVPNFFLNVVKNVVAVMFNLPIGDIKLPIFTVLGTVVFYLIYYVISKFIVLKRKPKAILCGCLAGIFAIICVVTNIPYRATANQMTCYATSNLGTLIETQENKLYLLNPELENASYIYRTLRQKGVSKLDGIIITDGQYSNVMRIKTNLGGICDNFYVATNELILPALRSVGFNVYSITPQETQVGDLKLKAVNYLENTLGVLIEFDGKTIFAPTEIFAEHPEFAQKYLLAFAPNYVKIDVSSQVNWQVIFDSATILQDIKEDVVYAI